MGWTDGYKKQKIQGWNAREGVKEHNSARGPSPGGSHEERMKTEATERKFGGRVYMAFETPNSERSIKKTSSKTGVIALDSGAGAHLINECEIREDAQLQEEEHT